MPHVRLENVSRDYGRIRAVQGVELEVQAGEFLTLLGPSGCGKTTILRLIAGFAPPSSGKIFIGGQDVTKLPPYRRNAGVVFQTYALFPHMSVARNIAFGLRMRRLQKRDIAAQVQDALRLMQLETLRDRMPSQLSGGQQQRVALARAIVIKPDVLLMDEPLSALDLKLRHELQAHIRRVQREFAVTTIYVTHDQGEALSMSDRVAVMRDGRIQQIDTPRALYERPLNSFVAKFVGRTNLLPVEILNSNLDSTRRRARPVGSDARFFSVPETPAASALPPGYRCLLGFRPENSSIEQRGANEIRARVEDIRYFGATRSVLLTHEFQGSLEVDLPAGAIAPQRKEQVSVWWSAADSFLLPADD